MGQISLAQPAWLSRLNVTQPQNLDEVKMVAIAVDNAGFKLNLKGWTPAHYWGPGLVEQLIASNNPVVVSFDGFIGNPKIQCLDFEASDKDSKTDRIDSKQTCETLKSPTGVNGVVNKEYLRPWDQLVSQQKLKTNALTMWEGWECMNAAELRKKGFVLDGAGMKTPEQFTPTDADFCIITFRLLPSPFLNRSSLEQRNTAVWLVTGEAADNGQVGQKGATTFVAPRLDRSRSWYSSIGNTLDITDNIYIGAHPGHNQQDMMVPFDQLGIEHSPADFFNASTASYAPDA